MEGFPISDVVAKRCAPMSVTATAEATIVGVTERKQCRRHGSHQGRKHMQTSHLRWLSPAATVVAKVLPSVSSIRLFQ